MAKKIRELKVHAQSGFQRKEVPQILLKGAWLREIGFEEHTPIAVLCEAGKIVIIPQEDVDLADARMVAESVESC